MTDYTELKRLAEAATPGPWDRGDGNEVSVSFEGDEAYWMWESAGPAQLHGSGDQSVADADFIAAASPVAVLALIAEIETLKAGFKNFHRSLCERFGYFHDDIDWQRDQVSLEEHIATQFNHVNAENSSLRGQMEMVQRGAGQLKAENEALRKDAERYRSLRKGLITQGPECMVGVCIDVWDADCTGYLVTLEEADQAIDAAISKEAVHG
ncbi:hypothetical protein ACVWZ9_004009 [Pseudomonas chlororaphis]